MGEGVGEEFHTGVDGIPGGGWLGERRFHTGVDETPGRVWLSGKETPHRS